MLRVERLESRDTPYVINLDFSGFGTIFKPDNFGQLNGMDEAQLERKIAVRMRTDFPGYLVRINRRGDFTVKFGGDVGDGILGVAYIAFPRSNVSGACHVYSDTLWRDLLEGDPDPSTQEIVNAFAQTASHEVGHMLGLGHENGTIMTAFTPLPPPFLTFNAAQRMEIHRSLHQPNFFFPDV